MVTRIKVKLKNGSEVLFPHYVLDHFIKKGGIIAFERSDGWVYLDRNPVRKIPSSGPFSGEKKRQSDSVPKKRVADRLFG